MSTCFPRTFKNTRVSIPVYISDWYARITSRPAYAVAMPPAGSEGVQPDDK